MDLHEIINQLENELKNIGFDENHSAMLLQINIEGYNYIRSIGNLNSFRNFASSPELLSSHNTCIDFIQFLTNEIEFSVIRSSTKVLHLDTLRLLTAYQSEIDIASIDSDYLSRLTIHMRDQCHLATNTIAKHMKVIKRYLNVARKKNIILKDPFSNYRIQSERTYREFLTEKELFKLEEYRNTIAPDNEALNSFLFSCYTGLRYSDIITVTKQDIILINKKRWLVKKMQKTSDEVRVPLSAIFNGRALELVKHIRRQRGIIFKLSSPQQTNRELKRIVKTVGIKKNITFHSARHTCATLLIYRGVNITTVQKILGHKNVVTTQIYSAVTDLTIENDIKRSNKLK